MHLYVTRHGQTQWNALDKVLGRTDIPLDETGLAQADALARSLTGEPIDLILTSPLQRTVQTGAAVSRVLAVPVRTADELIEMNFGIYEGTLRSDPAYQTAKAQYFSRYPQGESFLDIAARVYPFLCSLPDIAAHILQDAPAQSGAAGLTRGPRALPRPEPSEEPGAVPRRDRLETLSSDESIAVYSNVNSREHDILYRTEGQHELSDGLRTPRGVLLVTHNGICRVIRSYFEPMTNDEFRTFALPNCGVMRYEL